MKTFMHNPSPYDDQIDGHCRCVTEDGVYPRKKVPILYVCMSSVVVSFSFLGV